MRTLCKVNVSRTAPSDPRLLLLLAGWQWHLVLEQEQATELPLLNQFLPPPTPPPQLLSCVSQFGSLFLPSTWKSHGSHSSHWAALQARIPWSEGLLHLHPQAASPHTPSNRSKIQPPPSPAQGYLCATSSGTRKQERFPLFSLALLMHRALHLFINLVLQQSQSILRGEAFRRLGSTLG